MQNQLVWKMFTLLDIVLVPILLEMLVDILKEMFQGFWIITELVLGVFEMHFLYLQSNRLRSSSTIIFKEIPRCHTIYRCQVCRYYTYLWSNFGWNMGKVIINYFLTRNKSSAIKFKFWEDFFKLSLNFSEVTLIFIQILAYHHNQDVTLRI